MKRMKFATPEELAKYCLEAQVSLVVEYQDENKKQRQVTLTEDSLSEVPQLYKRSEVMSYFKHNGIFYEVVPEWNKK